MCQANHQKRSGIFWNLKPLVLASQSPRRRELLSSLGLSFEVRPPYFEEPAPTGEPPSEYVQKLARAKACEVALRLPEAAVLAADTVVALDAEILGKPRDLVEARQMLQRLSGRKHEVFTGYAILTERGERVRAVRTEVIFKPLTPEEIEAYLSTGEPLDKAGAYAIQGLASYMVQEVRGSVTNVIGLPLSEVVSDLLELGLVTWVTLGD